MERTPIQKHATALVQGMIAQSQAIGDIDHPGSKGKLRELFVGNCLQPFLTTQFGLGTGHIINHIGEQSPECDIISYDNRIVPPFIKHKDIGLFPFESVIAVIEVKSILDSRELTNTSNNFTKIIKYIYDNNVNIYGGYYISLIDPKGNIIKTIDMLKPFLSVISFKIKGLKVLKSKDKGVEWLEKKAEYINSLCVIDMFHWLHLYTKEGPEWRIRLADKVTNEETKRFIFTMLDNVRTIAENRYNILTKDHYDWLGIYLRDQVGIRKELENRERIRDIPSK